MPVSLVDRLPLPSLKVYSAVSVLLLSVAVYTAMSVTSDPNWRANATLHKQESPAGPALNQTNNVTNQFVEVMTFMLQEPLCMWTLINMAYCSLALFGVLIQRLVFGKLRVAEAQRVKEKFWNYLFYKFIFVFGVLSVQYMDEVLLWCAWFTLVGFLHVLGQLCKDRFDYLSSAPTVGGWAQTRLLVLVVGILCAASALMAVAFAWGLPAGKDTFAFMVAECLLVGLSAMHVLARFALRARDADAAGPAAYYTHLAFDACGLITETCHVAHMVVYSNVVMSMASVVLLMHLRHLLHALLARVQRHRLYSALADHMSRNYPMASAEEVRKNEDNCAICWEPMKEARKLPCAHLFHNSCLCRWVQQDASCPTCRRSLSAGPEPPQTLTPLASPLASLPPLPRDQRRAGRANHLFHFDGSRYVSWLPSFSVEVTRVRDTPTMAPPLTRSPLLDAMAAQVQQLFPQYPRALLIADLTLSRSPDLTIDNILEGRLPPPPTAPIATPAPAVPSAQQAPSNTTPETMQPSSSNDVQLENDEGGVQFSSTAPRREAMLKRRKDALLAAARRRFLERVAAASPASPSAAAPAPAASAESSRS